MRRIVIAGNWKMNTERDSAAALGSAIAAGLVNATLGENVDIVLCPPFPLIPVVGDRIGGSRLKLGAQDVHDRPPGAYTGEVSTKMLVSVGCTHVIVGHSERRMMFAESDLDVCYKANAAQDAGLHPIICVGETEAERENNRTEEVLRRQVRTAVDGLFEFNIRNVIIAYEPIWAIGTDNPATPEQAEHAHAFIRDLLVELYSQEAADDISIIYGGSMKPDNARELLAQPNIDGGLVGGASLDAASFLGIIKALT